MGENMLGLGERLRNYRQNKGLSQAELGKILKKSKSAISGYESDSRTPSADILVKLAALYNVSVDELLGIAPKASLSPDGLTEAQRSLIFEILAEFKSSAASGATARQHRIISKLSEEFILLSQK